MSGKKVMREKLPLTGAQKSARVGLGFVVALIIVLILGLAYFALAAINAGAVGAIIEQAESMKKVEYENQAVPSKDASGRWTFENIDRPFRAMQITDVHIGGGVLSAKKDVWALNAVASMISREKPDLVIVTGDIAFPLPHSSLSLNNLNGAKIFSRMMERLGVYWTFAFGNHDTEAFSYYSREELSDWYKSQRYKYFLYDHDAKKLANGDPVDGRGNGAILVKNSAGLVVQALVTLDSHSYTDGDYFGMLWKYDNIKKSQTDWYKEQIAKINEDNRMIDANAPDAKSMAFFHIPLREYRDAYRELYEANANVKNFDADRHSKLESVDKSSESYAGITNTDQVEYKYGLRCETMGQNVVKEETYGVFCGMRNDDLYEEGRKIGLQATFCGHDHKNNFSLVYARKDEGVDPPEPGMRLSYGMSIDYLAYPGIWKEKTQRGCTLITVNEDGSFDCELSSYYKEVDGRPYYEAKNKQ